MTHSDGSSGSAQKLLFSGEPELGAVKFLTNGAVVTSNGESGTWTLFDADSGIYTVINGGHRITFAPQRGQALVETANKQTVFEFQH
jgi:hypothetical protein